MRKIFTVIAAVLALPAFLFVYNPSMQLGGFGMFLGMLGMTISPLIILFALGYMVLHEWKR